MTNFNYREAPLIFVSLVILEDFPFSWRKQVKPLKRAKAMEVALNVWKCFALSKRSHNYIFPIHKPMYDVTDRASDLVIGW